MKRLIKTQAGLDAFNARSLLLTRRQRPIFLLCDGQRGVDAVLAHTAMVGATMEDVDYLVAHGFLAWAPEADTVEVPPLAAPPAQRLQNQPEGRALDVENWTMF